MKAETAPASSSQASGNYRRILSDYRALDHALLAGDLPRAREAFARLQEDSPPIAAALSNHPFPTGNAHLRALKELGRSLLNGDLPGAKQAFHQFQ
ncbi:MAG: hypothetical protein HYV95_08860 [Opitutae bacterium]|nr:hypothetical protein [Opitutae bacterium]